MINRRFSFKAKVWLYQGNAAWHFVTVPEKTSAEIKKGFEFMKRGWGSLPVTVTIGKTKWETSIFADKKRGGYLLPLKADVRKAEGISVDETIGIAIEIRV